MICVMEQQKNTNNEERSQTTSTSFVTNIDGNNKYQTIQQAPPPSTHHNGPSVLFLHPCAKHRPKYGHLAKVGFDRSAHGTRHQSFGFGFNLSRVFAEPLQSAPLGQRTHDHDASFRTSALLKYSGSSVLSIPLQSATVLYGGFLHAVLLLLGMRPSSQVLHFVCMASSAYIPVVAAHDTHV